MRQMRFTAARVMVWVLAGCAQPQRPMSAEEMAWQQKVKNRVAELEAQSVPVVYESMGCTGHGNVGYIHSYAVQETIHGQFSRGMISGLSCGGIVAAGYPVPVTWTPGMKVKVRWNRPIKGEDNWIEKTTTIPRYDEVGMLIVHFFPNDEERVVVSNYYPESPNHPIDWNSPVPPPEVE